jgi:hypothetical protein
MDSIDLFRLLFQISGDITDKQAVIIIYQQFIEMEAKLKVQDDILSLRILQMKESK